MVGSVVARVRPRTAARKTKPTPAQARHVVSAIVNAAQTSPKRNSSSHICGTDDILSAISARNGIRCSLHNDKWSYRLWWIEGMVTVW